MREPKPQDDGKPENAQGPREGPRAIPSAMAGDPAGILSEYEKHRAWKQLEEVKRARLEAVAGLERAQLELASLNRSLIESAGTLRDQGVSVREIAERLELSPQFLYQLAKRAQTEEEE